MVCLLQGAGPEWTCLLEHLSNYSRGPAPHRRTAKEVANVRLMAMYTNQVGEVPQQQPRLASGAYSGPSIGFRNVISSGLGICQSLAGATVVDFAGLPTNDDETPGLGVRSELHSMF